MLRDVWDYEKMYIIFSGAFVANVFVNDSPREKIYNFEYQVVWFVVIHYTKTYCIIYNILTSVSYRIVVIR